MNKKRAFLYFGLIVILILLFACISAILGSVRIPLLNVWRILLGDRTDLMQTNIICNIRLPRIVAAILLVLGIVLKKVNSIELWRIRND